MPRAKKATATTTKPTAKPVDSDQSVEIDQVMEEPVAATAEAVPKKKGRPPKKATEKKVGGKQTVTVGEDAVEQVPTSSKTNGATTTTEAKKRKAPAPAPAKTLKPKDVDKTKKKEETEEETGDDELDETPSPVKVTKKAPVKAKKPAEPKKTVEAKTSKNTKSPKKAAAGTGKRGRPAKGNAATVKL